MTNSPYYITLEHDESVTCQMTVCRKMVAYCGGRKYIDAMIKCMLVKQTMSWLLKKDPR